LQDTRQREQDEKAKAAASVASAHELKRQNEDAFFAGYARFKQLHDRLEHSPNDRTLSEELREIRKQLYDNKEMFGQIDRVEPDMGKSIKHLAKSKDPFLEQQRQLQKEMDRGFSL